MKPIHLYLEDQAPRIGAGWRTVDVISIGPKWVRIKERATGRGCRVARPVFDQLKYRELEKLRPR